MANNWIRSSYAFLEAIQELALLRCWRVRDIASANRHHRNNYLRQLGGGVLLEPFNPLTQELNPSLQRCLTRFFTADFS
jgi:hypothetical protein